MKYLLRLLLLPGLLSITVWADTHYANPAGGNVFPYTSPATAAVAVIDAVNAASAGDTVELADGIYPIAATPVLDGIDMTGASTNSILRVSGFRRALIATNATLRNLTFEGGALNNDPGAGLLADNCIIESCVFRDNVMSSDFSGSPSGLGPLGVGLHAVDSDLSGCVFHNNTNGLFGCHTPHVQGGGAYVVRSTVRDCRFFDNQTDDGAALYATDNSTVTGCLMFGNRQNLSHPVVVSNNSILSNCVVRGNEWGVWARESSRVVDCEIVDNIGPFGTGGGFAVCVSPAPGGGGLYLQNSAVAERCLVSGNSSGTGAGVYIGYNNGAPPVLRNCLVVDNVLQSNEFFGAGLGSGVLLFGPGVIEHNTFADNRSAADGFVIATDVFVTSEIANTRIRNNIIHGNEGQSIQSNLWNAAISRNIIEGLSLPGNLDIDPQLDLAYRLTAGSPAIDAGDPAGIRPLSYFGLPRLLGSGTDIGADEYHPPLIITDVVRLGPNQCQAAWNSMAGVMYQVEHSAELTPANWSPSGAPVIGVAGSTNHLLPLPGSRGFYRLRFAP